VDVSDLSAAVAGRQIERHYSARASEDARRPASRASPGSATGLIGEYVKVNRNNGEKRRLFVFCNFFNKSML
jgi:hypothetical protein